MYIMPGVVLPATTSSSICESARALKSPFAATPSFVRVVPGKYVVPVPATRSGTSPTSPASLRMK